MASIPSWSVAGTAALGAAAGGAFWKKFPFVKEEALIAAAETVMEKARIVEELIKQTDDEEAGLSPTMKLVLVVAALCSVLLLLAITYLYTHHQLMSQREIKGKGTLRVTSVHVTELHRHVEEAAGMKQVTITVANAKKLQNVDGGLFSGKSDPYVVVKSGKNRVEDIKPAQSTCDPVFDHSFPMNWKVGEPIIFEIWDKNTIKQDVAIGQCTVKAEDLGHLMTPFSGENMKVVPLNGSKPLAESTLTVKITPGTAEDHVSAKQELKCSLKVGKDLLPLAPKKEDHPTWAASEIVLKGKPHEFAVDFDAKVDKKVQDTRYLQVELCFEGRKGSASIYIGDAFARYEGERLVTQAFAGDEAGMIEVKGIYTPAKGKPGLASASAAKAAAEKAAADKAAADKAAAAKAAAATAAPAKPAEHPSSATQHTAAPAPAAAKKTA